MIRLTCCKLYSKILAEMYLLSCSIYSHIMLDVVCLMLDNDNIDDRASPAACNVCFRHKIAVLMQFGNHYCFLSSSAL